MSKDHENLVQRTQKEFRRRYPRHRMGTGTYGVPQVHDWKDGTTLTIGNYSSIAKNVHIFLGGNHRTDWVSCYPFPAFFAEAAHVRDFRTSRGDIVIGSDVWICYNASILSGVTIGHGAVVAAGAVVTRDVEPYSIVAGNPAQHVKWRFDEDTRKELLQIAWWNWPEEEILKIVDKLCTESANELLAYARSKQHS